MTNDKVAATFGIQPAEESVHPDQPGYHPPKSALRHAAVNAPLMSEDELFEALDKSQGRLILAPPPGTVNVSLLALWMLVGFCGVVSLGSAAIAVLVVLSS